MKMKLLNPGPVTLTERVRKALLRDDLCHRESEFAELTRGVMTRLSRVYPEAEKTHVPVLLTASGTGAVEAMLSLVPKAGKVLVVANGVYGERAAAMLEAQGKAFEIVKSGWLEPMDLGAAEALLKTKAFSHAFAVHHETTTGRLNDVGALGRMCKMHGTALLLDAVSSFGGEHIRFEDWNLEACAATANKCLHGVPGIAFVIAQKDALARPSGATSVYLDLKRYAAEQEKGFSPFTQSVQAMFGLDEALAEFAEQGGVEARNHAYRQRTALVMDGLAKMNVTTLLGSRDAYSSILTSYRMPSSLSYDKLHDHLKARGFIIYAGQGRFQGEIFRIAVMGDVTTSDIERLLDEIRSAVR